MIRVLLVDDEEEALTLLEILLGQIGDVEVVGKYVDPVAAIKALSTAAVDAVFLDNHMPEMRGVEVARIIRETMPHMPIVFTTAYAEYAVEAFEIQSTDYLLKPIKAARLQNAVLRVKQFLSAAALQARRNECLVPAIHCFGGFNIQLPGDEYRLISWKTKKEKELCAFLIHHEGKPVNTALIIDSLWPEYELSKAKKYLYTCMSYLRKSLHEHGVPMNVHKTGPGFFIDTGGLTVDVTEFEQLLNRTLTTKEEPEERLYNNMNRMYKGEYMEACDYSWAAVRQAGIITAYIRALRNYYGHFRRQGHTELAIDSMQRILQLAPDSESDGRELIRLHLEAGNRSEARRVCSQLEQAVRNHLGAELEEETLRLLQQSSNRTEWQAQRE